MKETVRIDWNLSCRIIIGVGCLLGLSATLSSLGRAVENQPEPLATRLEFRVQDAKPNSDPVKSFRYQIEIYTANQEEPIRREKTDYRSDDGILRIPQPYPPFGRIRIWIEADDLEKGYRRGYGSFSYRIEAAESFRLPTIELEEGIVLTGKVFDAETGKPISGAEVAPMKWGHHFSWADWDEAVKTDKEGKYRITTGSAEGIAVRHADYRETNSDNRPWGFGKGHNKKHSRGSEENEPAKEPEPGPDGFVFRLVPLLTLHGKIVDQDGKPISGATARFLGESETDAEGRFSVGVTKEEWSQRDRWKVDLSALNFKYREVPLEDFAFDREPVFTLDREQLIHGQVLDENGKPLENCQVEIMCESTEGLHFVTAFYPLPQPDKEGKWEYALGDYNLFTLRISVAGSVRSLKKYPREEALRGPLVTKLAEGRRLSGKLVAPLPLDDKTMPVIVLDSGDDEEQHQQGHADANGNFSFAGLADGKYTLRLYPASSARKRGGAMNQGIGGFTTFGVASLNKPWEKSITIQGKDVQLDPIDLRKAELLPGRLTGIVFQNLGDHKPFANAFGYLCLAENDFDSVGGFYYLLEFMTDGDGRFQVENCPPGKYVLRFSDGPQLRGNQTSSVWIHVRPEKTLDLRLFAPETDHHLGIKFTMGDGSSADIHAGLGLDAEILAKHIDPKTGEHEYIQDDATRLRAMIPKIDCDLQPLDETDSQWPIYRERLELDPRDLLKNNPTEITIPNMTPGRWRLTLTAVYEEVYNADEVLVTREFEFVKNMPPLKIELTSSSIVGTVERPADGWRAFASVDAIPKTKGLPTRTCRCQRTFRFIGLAPGEYTLRFHDDWSEEKRLDDVIVQKGKTTWLAPTKLKALEAEEKKTPENSALQNAK